MKLGTSFGILAIGAIVLNFAFYGGLIVLAVWAVGKYLL
jgi:hypothetical protein